jgi:hypothetical protein
MCAEEVQSQAVICRFCGYNFGTGQMPDQRTEQVDARSFVGMAVASLVLGLVGLVWWSFVAAFLDGIEPTLTLFTWTVWILISSLLPILAIVFGASAIRVIRASRGTRRGRGLAWAGIILGIVAQVFVTGFGIFGYIDGF